MQKRKNQERRKRWITSRMAMKYAMLTSKEKTPSNTTWKLSEDNLRHYSYLEYQEAGLPSTYTNLSVNRPDWYVSTTYNNESATLVVSKNQNISIDRERVLENASDAFIRYNFTEKEREWCHNSPLGLTKAQGYTFLWTLKEALLKQLSTATLTLWTFGRLQTSIKNFHWENKSSLVFEGTAQIADKCIHYLGHSEIHDDQILTIITIKS